MEPVEVLRGVIHVVVLVVPLQGEVPVVSGQGVLAVVALVAVVPLAAQLDGTVAPGVLFSLVSADLGGLLLAEF